jgi:hypothetical protein
MRITIFQLRIVTGALLLAAFHSINAKAESETVDGLTVQVGMAGSPKNPRAPLNIAKSPSLQPVLVTLSNADNGELIKDAWISMEVRGPLGRKQKKTLLHAAPAGPSNYGESFRFDASGQYLITVFVLKPGQGEPFEAIFTENVP